VSTQEAREEWAFSAVTASDAPDLLAFFQHAGSACFCRYWHFSGDKNAWLDRLAHSPATNAEELSRELDSAAAGATGALLGVVARAGVGGPIVGWMKLSGSERLQKLYDQRIYRRLPCFQGDRADVFSIGCFLVDPERRRRGIATGLLTAGIRLAQAAGARALEAFPRRAEMLGDEEAFMGPAALFMRSGFEVVHDFAPYPVLRRNF
jgi:GNAT superfamily N-acetyltransferase